MESKSGDLKDLIDELARVIYEPESARVLALRVGFPPASLPAFRTPLGFWSTVVWAADDGQLRSGVRELVDEAAEQYPGNAVFLRYRAAVVSRAADSTSVGSALPIAVLSHGSESTTELYEVETLLRKGERLFAIKALRELTGLGLHEAKEAIEWFEIHGHWPTRDRVGNSNVPVAGPNLSHQFHEVEALIRSGAMVPAMKALRELTGLGLKEAKDAIEWFNAYGHWPAS